MWINPLKTPDDHRDAMLKISQLWGAPIGTSEGDSLDALVDMVVDYEERCFPTNDIEK
ncbi:hypothetical protein GCM10007315_17610 [Gemmobacter tilapiae]|uniref:Uncharacterized protein n=1 Tax=Neogemmobacter tilapiae TaxID=875041 RepID=A0A918TN49_9RHOB|nr:hypothetical protein GCM10007315_17610 [Gemmobacter tilapiae]